MKCASLWGSIGIGVVLLLLAGGCPPPSTGPMAVFSADVVSGPVPLEVQFTNACVPGSSPITSYAWDFGDGGASTEAEPRHTYEEEGSYTVSLTVSTAAGSDTATETGYVVVAGDRLEPADFEPGAEVGVISEVVGPEGADLVGPAGTPLEGVLVSFPPGAVELDTQVDLGYETGTLTPAMGEAGDTVIVLNVTGDDVFEQPVEITFPFPEAAKGDDVPVPYHIDDAGRLSLANLVEVDWEAGTATFQIFHASLFAWILQKLGLYQPSVKRTGFVPAVDDFQIVNLGSTVSRGGECLGMTAFAMWYFSRHKADGNFHPRFMGQVGASGLVGQQIIATRAYVSIEQQWRIYQPEILRQLDLSDQEQAAALCNALVNTGKPVMMYLDDKANLPGNAHSVLAYKYTVFETVNPGIHFDVYDPNHPGKLKTIQFNATRETWNTYAGDLDRAMCRGDGSLHLTERFSFILEDAEDNFHSSRDAVIDVTSHSDNDEVTHRIITLSGQIQSGQIAVTELELLVNSKPYKTTVGFDGLFSTRIPIDRGENHFLFITRGNDLSGKLRIVNNNMFSQNFMLKGVFEETVIKVTLVWETAGTDVDLYVIDPTGDASWFNHRVTDDGGALDVDNLDGSGAEHWTLTTSDTVRWGQNYRVRLHYFDDHGHGPTNYTVTVMLYEGTDREEEKVYRGNIAVDEYDNYDPAATGPDWRDVAVATPTQAAAAATEGIRPPEPGEVFYVTVPEGPLPGGLK